VRAIHENGSTKAADNRTSGQQRILELEKENKQLRMEVDVLKTAALIFARK
jgi:transposase